VAGFALISLHRRLERERYNLENYSFFSLLFLVAYYANDMRKKTNTF